MNLLKKLAVILMAAIMVSSFAGCHKKNEIAVTVGDYDFTSAYYMCALVHADGEARSLVDEAIAEKKEDDEEASSSATEEVDYYSQKVEDTDFVKWVENRAIENIKKISAYKTKCKEADLKLDDEVKANAEQYAAYYWSNYGYYQLLEPNGVGAETYKNYMVDSYYSNLYFEHLYGEGGEKEIAADEVKTALGENFVVANKLEVSFSDMEETEIATTKTTFNSYVTALTDKSKTFEQIYKEHNKITDEEKTEETTTETEEEVSKPQDEYASILGKEDTAYASEQFETAKAMAVGEIKLVELENNAGLVLLVKQDVFADPYYLETLDTTVRDILKGDEFDKDMDKVAKELKAEINKYAVSAFKVKKIVYPEAQQ